MAEKTLFEITCTVPQTKSSTNWSLILEPQISEAIYSNAKGRGCHGDKRTDPPPICAEAVKVQVFLWHSLNIAQLDGGGIYADGSNLNFSANITISSNTAQLQ